MGLISFFKDAGEKLFHSKDAKAAEASSLNTESIKKYIQTQGLRVDNLEIGFDSVRDTVTVAGKVADQATKEKVLLCCGNINGVANVDDRLTVTNPAPASQYYTVKSGDTLSKISKELYGDANKYNLIFEANRPMLSHPDKIYPGQNLRIPPQATSQQKMAQL
ncbi:peptidoglycan-binding protein LysM [Bdellovibrio svalbardensis]|uniref:Peptidoglycan-binding protein LysM n=1 Tax=Bdellovibrio svalbardensis TaxID=2972972 RepID=A0ABT6DJU0_9BACT|nr:peptidoglycan-binding protein LysM [Bdellovibrio svalbardensis]MDG0817133.1 peptidoglycan-binding protein LysM [Bdellovibrio svalbardensis]